MKKEKLKEDKRALKTARPDRQVISTGHKNIDRVFGGGLRTGRVSLLTGQPGIGKTTLAMQVAGGVVASGEKVLFASAEMDKATLDAMRKRIKVKKARLEIRDSYDSITDIENAVATAMDLNASVLVIDSVQTFYVDGVSGAAARGTRKMMSAVVSHLHTLLTKTFARKMAVLLIGLDWNGIETVRHASDACFRMEPDQSGKVWLIADKNRDGLSNSPGTAVVFSPLSKTGFNLTR